MGLVRVCALFAVASLLFVAFSDAFYAVVKNEMELRVALGLYEASSVDVVGTIEIVGKISLLSPLVLGPSFLGLNLIGTPGSASPSSALSMPSAFFTSTPSYASPNSVLLIKNVSSVRIESLTVLYEGEASWKLSGAVFLQEATSTLLRKVEVQGGVQISGGSDNRLSYSSVSNKFGAMNGTCVYVPGCGNTTTLIGCNLTIDNNEVRDCRYDGKSPYVASAQGIMLGAQDGAAGPLLCTVGVIVRNNNLSNIDEMGTRISSDILCSNVLNEISYNKIQDWGQLPSASGGDTTDSGCLYTYGHWFSPGNTLLFNFCITTNASWGSNGAYFDDASTGQNLTGNIFLNSTAGSAIKLNGGAYNTADSNLVISGANFGFANCRGLRPPLSYIYTCENNNTGVRWMEELEGNNYLAPPWSEAFPFYTGWCTNKTAGPNHALCSPSGAPSAYECAAFPRGNTIKNLAGVGMVRNGTFKIPTAPGFPFLNVSSPCPTFVVEEEFNAVANDTFLFYESLEANFVNPAEGDYTIRDDSQIYVDMPNFKRIPFRSIGIGGNPSWD